jgi:predicted ribosomally synthesized peptide with SipW-like signal peptide
MQTTQPLAGRPTSTRRFPQLLIWGFAVIASLSLVSALVMVRSIAAFTDTTESTGNSFSTGTVELVDDDSGSVLFNVSGMVPGSSVTDCITVTYQGTVTNPSAVKLYSGGYTDSGTLASYLDLSVEEGSGGSFGDCTGFTTENTIESGGTLADFDSTHTNYSNGAGVWDPSGTPESKTYRITVTLNAAAPDSQQGQSVTAQTFTWEVQS